MFKCILATGTTADLGPSEIEFNFPLILYRCVCSVRLGACVVSRVLKPLWLAGALDMASSHNGGFILPTVKRLSVLRCAYVAQSSMTIPSAYPCLQHMYLQCCKCAFFCRNIVLACRQCSKNQWYEWVFLFTIWFVTYCSIVYSAYFLLDNVIVCSSHSLSVFLSLHLSSSSTYITYYFTTFYFYHTLS